MSALLWFQTLMQVPGGMIADRLGIVSSNFLAERSNARYSPGQEEKTYSEWGALNLPTVPPASSSLWLLPFPQHPCSQLLEGTTLNVGFQALIQPAAR